eukprot:14557119-Alexandrium_andersonii.AAC.1
MPFHVDIRAVAQHLAHLGGCGVAGGQRAGGVLVGLRLCRVLEVELGEDLLAPSTLLDPVGVAEELVGLLQGDAPEEPLREEGGRK